VDQSTRDSFFVEFWNVKYYCNDLFGFIDIKHHNKNGYEAYLSAKLGFGYKKESRGRREKKVEGPNETPGSASACA